MDLNDNLAKRNKISKLEAVKIIDNFFENIKDKNPKEIKRIKKLAMSFNIKLGKNKKLFCKKCFHVYDFKDEIRVKKGFKIVGCKQCGYMARLNLN